MNRSHLINELLEAKSELAQMIEKLEELEKNGPEGTVYVRNVNGRSSYYLRADSSDKTGRYLSRKDLQQIKALAQKQYNHKLKKATENELKKYEKCLDILDTGEISPNVILRTISQPLHEFIDTEVLSDKKALEEFEKGGRYKGNPNEGGTVYLSPRGEKFKSKSEWIIADMLREYNVPYYYEKPLVNSIYEELRTSSHNLYPDFTCLNRRTGKTYYWEHFGMLEDPVYAANFVNRIQNYASFEIYPGSELIVSVEAKRSPLRISYIKGLIERFLI